MTQPRALSLSYLTAVAAVLLLAAPASAQQTECQPDDLFCAEVRIGPAQGGIRIGPGHQQPAPPPAQPPTVIVQPQPQPPPPPQPPVVVVQPQARPVYRPRPVQTYVVQQPPQQVHVHQPRDRFPYSSTGIQLHVDGIFGDRLGMGGAGAAFRIRPNPWFALDIGGALYGGTDYNGLDRVDVPLTVDAIFFFNPHHRFQFYALVGVGAAYSYAQGYNINTNRSVDGRSYFHLGGEAGIGIEWRISRVFALNFDVRGFLRQRVDENPEPEFIERNALGGTRSTDLSGGMLGRAGMTFYFDQ